MTMSPEFDEFLTKSGISLASLGIRDVGLLRDDALKAVEILRHAKLPILGGDVYFRRGDQTIVAHANWYAEPKPTEDHESYLRRSWEKAEMYLKSFPEPSDAEVLFSIVVGRVTGVRRVS
jgi:hypothetical protein